ncbi:hypothetical protein PDK26_13290 [Bacillus cereus]|nr:hypothetical protein [Bacillus cereus]MDA2617914.1 hypothetical protein [Bacillus cereus]
MAWARELERIEAAKAKERQGTRKDLKSNIVENFPQSKSRDVVAEKIGIGSGKQYEKAKFIEENADRSIIDQLDEEKISTHKAYMKTKKKLSEDSLYEPKNNPR